MKQIFFKIKNFIIKRIPYNEIFGGVCSLNKTHFENINGFSNIYFGWGGEDDDLRQR